MNGVHRQDLIAALTGSGYTVTMSGRTMLITAADGTAVWWQVGDAELARAVAQLGVGMKAGWGSSQGVFVLISFLHTALDTFEGTRGRLRWDRGWFLVVEPVGRDDPLHDQARIGRPD